MSTIVPHEQRISNAIVNGVDYGCDVVHTVQHCQLGPADTVDPLTANPDELADAPIVMTMIGGDVVHRDVAADRLIHVIALPKAL
jgi:hypothetical protein